MISFGNIVRTLIWSTVIGIIIYVCLFIGSDINNIKSEFDKISFLSLVVVLTLSLVNYSLRYLRWDYYLGFLGNKIDRFKGVVIYLSGFAFSTTPAKSGEVVRSYYLSSLSVRYSHSMAALLVERIFDLLVVALLSVSFVFLFDGFILYFLFVVLFVVVVLFLLICKCDYPVLFLRGFKKSEVSNVRNVAGEVSDVILFSKKLISSGYQFYWFVLGLIAWGSEGVAFYIILDSLQSNMSIVWAISIYSASILIGAVSLLPGGLGSTEASMFLLLTMSGVDSTTAAAATFVCRVATLWFAVFIGLLAIIGLEITGFFYHERQCKPLK